MAMEIKYNGGVVASVPDGAVRLNCAGMIAAADIVAALGTGGKITYNGKTTNVEGGSALLPCRDKLMLTDVVFTTTPAGLYDAEDNLVASWYRLTELGMMVSTAGTLHGENVLIDNPELSSGTKLIIHDSVKSIGQSAFSGCGTLTAVIIPNSVIAINNWAFIRCANLTSITVPDSVTYIGSGVFTECNRLIYNRYNGANYLGNEGNPYHAFMKQGNITNGVMHENTKVIANYACWECTTLKSLVVNGKVKEIAQDAFNDCTNLESVTIGHGVESIGTYAFSDCTSLVSVIIPDSITTIGYYAFSDCTRLTDVYYRGTEEQWADITIGTGNEELTNATIHYNYTD